MLSLFVALAAAPVPRPPIEWRANIAVGQRVDLANGFFECPVTDAAHAALLVSSIAHANLNRDKVLHQAGCTQHWNAGPNPGWQIDRKVGDSCAFPILRHQGAIIDGVEVSNFLDCSAEAHGYVVERAGHRRFVVTSETADDDM